MDIKEFFYNGGVVKCVDRTESDVVIEMCRNVGIQIYPGHEPESAYHGVFWKEGLQSITFWKVGSDGWNKGVPFPKWLSMIREVDPVNVDDLI